MTDWLAHFPGKRILILGDVMLDAWVHGSADRVSPEAPIPVLRVQRRESTLGGAGNVARNVADMGGIAVLVGAVGDDGGATEVAAMIRGLTGVEDRLVRLAHRPTTVKTRYVASRQQLLRVDEEETGPLDDAAHAALLASFLAALPGVDAVLLSDYAKGVLAPAVMRPAIDAARAAGKPVLADPKSLDFGRYRGVSVLTPNRLEASRATGIDCADDESCEAAGRAALTQAGAEAIIITRSERGLTLVPASGPVLHLPTEAREVFDVSGAGDTLIGTLAVALAAGAPLDEAAALANAAAGLAVAKPGTASVGREELADALRIHDFLESERKVVSLHGARGIVEGWRQRGLRVGFTNGCFDLIHPGHVTLLARARAACDRLIVGLNSDESVRRLKGPTRPIQNETARATVMASIGAVDLVVLFGEDTPLELIRALRPAVLIKGADYRLDQVVGADLVAGWGGRVALVPLEAGQSTTGTIGRIRAAEAR